jgi:hypothetical protein
LKTAGSAQPIPIPRELALLLAASVQAYPSEVMVTNMRGTEGAGPQIIGRAMRDAKEKVAGLPEGFSFHDLRPLPGVAVDRQRRGHQDGSGADAARERTNHARHVRASVAGRRRVHPLGGWRRHLGTDELSRSYCGPTADPLTTATMSVLVSALAGLHVVVEHVLSLTRTMDNLSYPVGTMDG